LSGQLNGHGMVAFDGVDDILGKDGMNSIPTGSADRTLLMVVEYQSNGWGGLTFGTVACHKMWGLTVSASQGNALIDDYCSANVVGSGAQVNGAGWLIQSAVIKDQQLKHFVNGQLVETLDASAYDTTDLKIRLGAEHNDNVKVKMNVADVIHYNRALSQAERQQVEQYLSNRYLQGGGNVEVTSLTLATVPAGLSLTLDGESVATPQVLQLATGTNIALQAGSVHCVANVKYTFASWSDGVAAAARSLTLEEAAMAVSAIYAAAGPCDVSNDDLPVQAGLVMHLDADEITAVSNDNKVQSWPDLSAGSSSLAPLSGFDAPLLEVNELNGHSVVTFDGVDDALGRGDIGLLPAGAADRTLMMVVKYDSAGWGKSGGLLNLLSAVWETGKRAVQLQASPSLHAWLTAGGFTYGSASCMGSFGPTVSVNLGQLMCETFCTNGTPSQGERGWGGNSWESMRWEGSVWTREAFF
jgi:hypothetical protein